MMSSMNPSIDAYVDVMSTAKGYAISRWISDCCFSSCGSKDRCGEFRSSVSQDSPRSRFLRRSIAASLTVVYYACVGVVPMGNLMQRKASSSTIAMYVDVVVAFACIQCYAAPRSVFPIRIRFGGYLLRIVEIMCRILSRHKP